MIYHPGATTRQKTPTYTIRTRSGDSDIASVSNTGFYFWHVAMGNKEIFILLLTLIASSWSLSHSSVFEQINEIVVEEPIGCSVQVVESIPEGLVYNDTWQPNLSTFKVRTYCL